VFKNSFICSILTRLVGGCTDGEYLQKRIHNQFLGERCLNVVDEGKTWYNWEWDKAHIVELAVSEASKVELFKNVDAAIHNINKKITHGKAFAEMQTVATEAGERFYTPFQASQTRFAAYGHRVLDNFRNNFNFIYDYLNKNQDDDQYSIDNVSFVLGLSLKTDIMKTISNMSRDCQEVNSLPWRRTEYINSTLAKLEQMVESVGTNQVHESLVHVDDCLKELTEHATFQQKPITFERLRVHCSRLKKSDTQVSSLDEATDYIKKQGERFVSTFSTQFRNRVNKYENESAIYPLIEASFKLENIVNAQESRSVPEEFIEYFRLAKSASYLPEDILEDEILDQYRAFSFAVSDLVQQDKEFHPNDLQIKPWVVEQRVFNKIFNSKCYQSCRDVTDLLLSACVRAQSEAPCESMGSYIKNVAEYRPIDHKNLEKEVFISYNGPDQWSDQCEKLVFDALSMHFAGKPNWHFYKKEETKGKLDSFLVSKVVQRKAEEAKLGSRVPYK
jgi:hypothetical protein